MIEKTLILLGLKDKEVTVYLAIMHLGKTTPAQIAEVTGINRATVYSVAKILLKKGLIQEDLGSSSRQLVALPPKELDILIDKERKRIKRKEELVEQAIEELSALPLNTQYSVPQIRFVEGDNFDLYAETEKWSESLIASDPTMCWWGYQDLSFLRHYEDWIDWYWANADERITLKLLSNETPEEEAMKKKNLTRRVIKYFDDAESEFTATTWILGDYVVMIYTHAQPFYMIEIKNPTLAHNYRELFKTIWPKY
jgi:sugar-specific transcriptional regulator TrmB